MDAVLFQVSVSVSGLAAATCAVSVVSAPPTMHTPATAMLERVRRVVSLRVLVTETRSERANRTTLPARTDRETAPPSTWGHHR